MNKTLSRTFLHRGMPELLIYLTVWVVVFLFPVASNLLNLQAGEADSMLWREIFRQWLQLLPFLLLFVVNDRWLVPRLFFRQRVTAYVVVAIALTAAVIVGCDLLGLTAPGPGGTPVETAPPAGGQPSGQPGAQPGGQFDAQPGGPMQPPTGAPSPQQGQVLPPEGNPGSQAGTGDFPPPRDGGPRMGPPDGETILTPLHKPVLGRVLMALLMLSFNVAVKLFFRYLLDKSRLRELERVNLQTELGYLKYQLNPHFFMNTLNNIHALVDIDADKAKDTIVGLSRLMRYMLYEADRPTVPLTKEMDFLRHYIDLMRIRFPESVSITLSLPPDPGTVHIPPLLFVPFVENAFKHGVNYQDRETFISVSLELLDSGRLHFHCANSNHACSDRPDGGIGLDNAGKRLQLLFGSDHTLRINETEREFEVDLEIPTQAAPGTTPTTSLGATPTTTGTTQRAPGATPTT